MNNFVFYSPTEFVFGKDTEQQAGALARKFGAHKVMIVYGGGSAVKSGLLERVRHSLDAAGLPYCEMGGVQPNPVDTKVYEGIDVCKREQADLMLAVGGGSVIDTAKAIAAGACYEGDFWDFFIGRATVKTALKVGVVLTIPAAGSEGSGNSVITKTATLQKLSLRTPAALRPVFSILNPETNAPSFKLTDLTEENGIEQEGAHDALVDVRATIAVAKLIKEKQPKLFQWALDHRSKNEIAREIKVLNHIPFLHTCPLFVSEKGNTHPLLPLFYEAEKSAALYCFDLTHEIPESAKGTYQETGIMRLMINRSPFIAPISTLDSSSEERLGFTKAWIWQKASQAINSPVLKKESILAAREPYEESAKDPDLTIYSSFPSDHDKGVMASIRAMKPADKISKGEHLFEDDKYHKLLWRQVARNWPEVLSEKDRTSWKNFCALRLINPPVEGTPTYELYMRSVSEKLESVDTDYRDKEILLKLKEYGEELFANVIK